MILIKLRKMGLSRTFFITAGFLFCLFAKAETYYVDKNHPGADNSNPGTENQPWLTVQKGASVLQEGDTLFIKEGNYEGLFEFSGLSGTPEEPIVMQSFPGHRVIFKGQGVNTGRVKFTDCSYLEIKGIEITYFNEGLWIVGGTYISVDSVSVYYIGQEGVAVKENSSHILFENCRVFDMRKWQYNGEGFYIGTGSAGPKDNTSYVTVRNCVIYNTLDEAIEFKPGTHHCIAEGNLIYNATSAQTWGAIEVNESILGVQSWNEDPEHIVRNNIVYSTNGTAIRIGTGGTVYNNVVYNLNSPYYGIYIDNKNGDSYPRNIYHNTVHLPSSRAIIVSSGTADVRNNIGPETTGNIPTDDQFYVSVESGSEDFRLVSGATPINAGIYVGVDTDLLGTPRPQGDGYNMGAYEGYVITGTISGSVTDSITGGPIEGAAVSDGTRSDTTDASGNYTIENVPVDTFTITASISVYLPFSIDGVVVTANDTSLVDFQLIKVPNGTISGTVTDAATGNPVPGALVSNGTDADTTDAGGNYIMEGLLLDVYTLSASASGYMSLSLDSVVVTQNDTSTADFQLTKFPDLVGFWAFEESSGTTAYDSSQNHNDGIIYGPTSTLGKSGLAFEFDGTDDYVTIPRSASLDGGITDEITLMAWIKIPAGSRYSIIERWLFGADVEERSFVLDIKKGQVWFGLSGDGTSDDSRFLLSSNTVGSDTWTHVAATCDGSSMNIYINAVLDPESNTSPSGIHPSAADVHIGKWEFASNQSDYPFNGTMDEVKIYKRALSAQEVEDDYHSAPVGIGKNLALENGGLQAYPNPLNHSTTIRYTTTLPGKVGISIYNMSGQKIRDLVDETQPADNHWVVWDGTDARGEPAGSGIFFCTFDIDDKPVATKKLVLLQ